MDSNPPTEGTWDYDHMDVSVTADHEDTETPDPLKNSEDISPQDVNQNPSVSPKFLPKQTSEDREVANFTAGQNSDLLATPAILSDTTSDSGDSTNKGEEEDAPTNR